MLSLTLLLSFLVFSNTYFLPFLNIFGTVCLYLDKCSRFLSLVIQRGLHVNALNYIGSSSKLMAVYQALTPRLNPLKMDQNSKKRGEKDNLLEKQGAIPC